MLNLRALAITAALMAAPLSASAEPDCSEAKDLLKLVDAFYDADPKHTNIIKPELTLALTALEGFERPDGIRYIYEGESTDLIIDEEGFIQNLESMLAFNDDGKLCKLVDGALVEETEEDSVALNMSFSFNFRDNDGTHDFETLREGLKDGSKIVKALAPGGLGFVVPSLKAIMVFPAAEEGEAPAVSFMSKGQSVKGPDIAVIGNVQMFRLKDLKKQKIEEIQISGDYRLEGQFDYDEKDIAEARAELASETDAK